MADYEDCERDLLDEDDLDLDGCGPDDWGLDDDNACPSCGSAQVIPILYGSSHPVLVSLAEHGLVEVAGRAFDGAQPSSRCRDCNHAWSLLD